MDVLSSPLWAGISGLAALLALFLTLYLERDRLRIKPLGQRLPFAVANLLVGVLVISIGFIVQPLIYFTLQYGFFRGQQYFLRDLATESPLSILLLALFPGTITVAATSSGKSAIERMRIGSIAAIVTLTIQDIVMAAIHNHTIGIFIFSVISNVVGGILAGIIIGFIIHKLANWFVTPNS